MTSVHLSLFPAVKNNLGDGAHHIPNMDCLDEVNLESLILNSLACSLDTCQANSEELKLIVGGLPETSSAKNQEDSDDLDLWDESHFNYIVSYCHYVRALPLDSPRLAESLGTVERLLGDIWVGAGDDLASSSSGRLVSVINIENAALPLLDALTHIGRAPANEERFLSVLGSFLGRLTQALATDDQSGLALALTLLSTYHRFALGTPLPSMSATGYTQLLERTSSLASSGILGNIDRIASPPSSPVSTSDQEGNIRLNSPRKHRLPNAVDVQVAALRRFTPLRLLVIVTDIKAAILNQALTPVENRSSHSLTISEDERRTDKYAADAAWTAISAVMQDSRSTSNKVKLGASAVSEIQSFASKLWDDLVHGSGIPIGGGLVIRSDRRHAGRLNAPANEDDDALMVSILKVLTLCSLHSGHVEDSHLTRLRTLLSDKSPSHNAATLETGLACTSILIYNFPNLANNMTAHIRRFATTPLSVFEAEMAGTGMEVPELMSATARCLAVCVQTSPNDDLISSTMYSLLNAVPQGGEGHGNASVKSGAVAFVVPGGAEGTGSVGKDVEHRRMMGISTIGMVTRLAVEIDRPDITSSTISMLLQRLRGADAMMEATIVSNLVPLTLHANNTTLLQVIRALSQISRSPNPEDPTHSLHAVLAAQTSLARGLAGRTESCDAFLEDLLNLFIDKAGQLQATASAIAERQSSGLAGGMIAQLAGLFLPIDAVLAHEASQPQKAPSADLIVLFRNMWFLSALLGLSHPSSTHISDSARQALARIAGKTPALVVESDRDYVASGLEYNAIFRRDYAQATLSKQRALLAEYLPKKAGEIRSLTLPQVIFLLATHDLELLRTRSSRPSGILDYFCNESINDSPVSSCLEAIADKLMRVTLGQLSRQVLVHKTPSLINEEVRRLLIGTTHRFRKVRSVALAYLSAILTSFAALMCDRRIVFALLEILTLLRRSCEDQYTDEYSPSYIYRSDKLDLALYLTDDFAVRNEMVTQLYASARKWLSLAMAKAPIEMQSILQSYLRESRDVLLLDTVELGAGLAMQFAKAIPETDRQEMNMPSIGGWLPDSANLLASQLANKNFFAGELSGARLVLGQGLKDLQISSPAQSSSEVGLAFKRQMADALRNINAGGKAMPTAELRRLLLRAASALQASSVIDREILHYLVALPMRSFTALGIAAGVDAWSWLISERPDVEVALISEVSEAWLWTIKSRKGLFSDSLNTNGPFEQPIEYSPTDEKTMRHNMSLARRLLQPHTLLIQVVSSRFQAVKYREPGVMNAILRLLMRSLRAHRKMSTHPLAREVRFSLVLFGLQVLASRKLETILEMRFRDAIYAAALAWFTIRPLWSFGSNRVQISAEIQLLGEVLVAIQNDPVRGDNSVTSLHDRPAAFPLSGYSDLRDYAAQHQERSRLLQTLIQNEIQRIEVWSNVTNDQGRKGMVKRVVDVASPSDSWIALVRRAWKSFPAVAIHMGERFKVAEVQNEIIRLVRLVPRSALDVPEALQYLLGDQLESASLPALKWLPLWSAVSPVSAVVCFQPRYRNNPLILQYAMRVLEQHPVELTFFFVPQVVQALRADGAGYVERFIFETSKISQLFCHQIIWNMKANCYKDDAGEIPDPMKPMLDRMVDMVVADLSGKARAFYDLEFNFFNAVTSISGKLKPYIKKSKPEKKAKIDEEMAKIDVSVGVYLPSNPDGSVVEMDKKSGRPLQSHAKAPFMATFKVRKERIEYEEAITDGAETAERKVTYDVWQAAIFKVGDDCRQDVLALQMIAMFKNIFMAAGLVLYLFPYRVTATAPGCGVIDVVPNATSRDEMGRAKINDLFGYFVDKYGSVDTIGFQKARMNFIQSMAAYSVACYILQIKDRHNGNIMIDGEGHIVHIDFGFLFDIGPGGVKFEPNSFKLNHEMVVLMGGKESQGYRIFTELTVKAFLAIRPFVDQLVDTVHLMLGTGLPSFKGEPTIKRLRERFQPQLSERAAADYMIGVIRNAHENQRSTVYDEFQRITNGIPY